MNVRFERDLSHHFMIPEWKDEFCEEGYQIHMLTENKITGLLKCSVRHMNGKSEYLYDITAKRSMGQIYSADYLKEEDILCIMRSLQQMVREIGKYLLDENCILLDPELIFIDEETKEVYFTYLPNYPGDIAAAYGRLSEYILHHLDQNDSRAVLLGYDLFRESVNTNQGLYQVLERAVMIKAEPEKSKKEDQVKETSPNRIHIEEEKREEGVKKPGKMRHDTIKEAGKEKNKREKKQKKEKRKEQKNGQEKKRIRKDVCVVSITCTILFCVILFLIWKKLLTMTQGGGISFLMVGIFGFILTEGKKKEKKKEDPFKVEKRLEKERAIRENGATTVLWEGEEEYEEKLSLISLDSREGKSFYLQNDSYLVGKMKSKVDIFLEDSAVSRVHAKLERKNGDYYLQDLHSTNGTFLNGRRLKEGESARLEFADEVAFAECGFYIGKC